MRLLFIMLLLCAASFLAQGQDAPRPPEAASTKAAPEPGSKAPPPEAASKAPPSSKGNEASDEESDSPPLKSESKKINLSNINFFLHPFFSAGGSMLFFIEDDSIYSDPMPVLPALYLGGGLEFLQIDLLIISGGISVEAYSTYYCWGPPERERALPAAIENRDALVFGFPLSLFFDFRFNLYKRADFRLSFALQADCRVVTVAEGLTENEIEETKKNSDKINEAFWQGLSWLFFQTELGFGIGLNEKTAVWAGAKLVTPFEPPKKLSGDSGLYGCRWGLGIKIIYKFN
ncbi:MAG: hypothetical protein Pg6A_09340 [Termitinemataceae bacterium]|jgi:hypothetical protein|nr:MAG: hypothetical protein Pg6A_09340 [Termitinemataceae bacterium]